MIVFVMLPLCSRNFGGNYMDPEEKRVLDAVRKHIHGRTPGGATLDVLEKGIRKDQEWWYVPILPSVQPKKRYEYYETLAEVEHELQKEENITVLFVPASRD